TCCARAFSTGTAARSRPSTSSAKPLTTCPGASGNCSLPSRMRLLGLKKTICTRVSAAPPAISTSTCSEASRTGCSAPCTCSIGASRPCIEMALRAGAAVMVTSHLGRPTEGAPKPEDSLAPVAARLAELLGRAVPLRTNWVDGVAVAPGEVVVLENCRLNQGEKKNDPALAKKMAALCDVYVNDAFGTAHRAEASTYGIAEFATVACAGPLLAAE